MGAAYFIVLERAIKGLDMEMDGKSLSRHIEALDDAARKLGCRPLSEFFSADPDELAEFLDGSGGAEAALPPLERFAAAEGLATVRSLLLDPVSKQDGIAQDLNDCARILEAAAEHDVRWHFEIDV